MLSINISLTPENFSSFSYIENPIVVVVDILRATSVISTAFHYGIKEIIPVKSVDEAKEYLNTSNHIVAAERNAMPLKGFEYGSGFAGSQMKGSQHNDPYNTDGTTQSNRSGGIQGGISNGMDIYFNVAFKPVATVMQAQDTIDNIGQKVVMEGKGRHDPCVVPRAVPIVEAMAALVLADFNLLSRTNKK